MCDPPDGVMIKSIRTADSEHCFDLSGLIKAVSVTDIYSRQYMPEKDFFACGL